ncbi:MAG TPA: hypothetical protein VGL54_09895 [Solirubrobacteraceae bacterium]
MATVAPVGVVQDRCPAGRKHSRYLSEVGRLIDRRHVNENIE